MNNQSTEQHWQVLVLLLKNIAAEKGITREQISDKTGMKASSISRIFSLRYRVTLANYVSIAQAIGVNLFIDDKDSKAVEDAEETLRKEQEQGDDIRDILIDFIADWYKDNPTVSKEKIIKMADNYLAKFPNGQPKQVTLKEANEIISKEHPDVRYTSEQPSIELSDEDFYKCM